MRPPKPSRFCGCAAARCGAWRMAEGRGSPGAPRRVRAGPGGHVATSGRIAGLPDDDDHRGLASSPGCRFLALFELDVGDGCPFLLLMRCTVPPEPAWGALSFPADGGSPDALEAITVHCKAPPQPLFSSVWHSRSPVGRLDRTHLMPLSFEFVVRRDVRMDFLRRFW